MRIQKRVDSNQHQPKESRLESQILPWDITNHNQATGAEAPRVSRNPNAPPTSCTSPDVDDVSRRQFLTSNQESPQRYSYELVQVSGVLERVLLFQDLKGVRHQRAQIRDVSNRRQKTERHGPRRNHNSTSYSSGQLISTQHTPVDENDFIR